jgi:hypothetical protein
VNPTAARARLPDEHAIFGALQVLVSAAKLDCVIQSSL